MKRLNFLSAGLLVVLLASCGQRVQNTDSKPTVKIDTVLSADKQTSLQFPGRVKAAQDISLAFRVSGTILRMHVNDGTYVQKGQLLAELDPTDYQIQLDAAEAEYQSVKAEAERVMALYKENVTTPDANDKAVYGLRQITAKYNHAKDQLEYTRLYAPFSGYVQKRLFDSHETLAAGMPVLSMISEGKPEVEINLPAVEYIRREQFTGYHCTFDVYPGQVYALNLISVTPKANANQLYTMRLQLEKTVGQSLPSPGMNTMVTIERTGGDARNLSVPTGAVLREKGNTSVFLYDSSTQTIRRCNVTMTRLLSNGRCLITSDELKPGNLIVASGVHHVKDGEQVEPLLPASETNVGGAAMIDISKWAFENKKLIYFLIAVLIIGGAYSSYEMSKLEDPEVTVKVAMVVTTYPGASAHQVELEVTDVLEKNIRTMGNIDNVESYSYNDLSLIQVELKTTVAEGDVEQCWDLLRRKVANAQAELPEGANPPLVKDDFGNVYGMFYALTGDGLSDRELSDYAELIKREVSELDGVERVDLYGKRSECINISLLQDRMANLGVKPAEVLATLNGQNKTTYTGYYDNGDNRIRVTVSDKFKTVEDIGRMLIQGHDDDQLRLSDIARIEKDYENPTRNALFYDRNRAMGILIAASSGSDIIKIGGRVEQKLEQLKAERLPAGVDCHKVFYQPERVSGSLGTFIINLIESVIIVVVILMIAMGFKSGMIIGISLVVTVFGSFLFLYFMDGTMQRVSLASFILAMGMLVDNAIVIIDGILVDLKAGKSRREAMTAIGRQTAMPLLGATLIAIIAFLPIFMSPDTAGVYTRDLFIVLAVSLLLSWVLALVHVPLMANRILHPEVSKETTDGGKRVYEGKVYAILRSLLRFSLAHRWSFVFTMVGLVALSAFSYRFMKQGFFPDMVYDQLYMEYKLPEGTNYTRVTRDLADIEAYLKTRPEITHVTASVGGTPGRYNLVRNIANPSLSYGELIIDFTSPDALVDNMPEIQQYLSAHYPDAYVKMNRYNLMFKKYPIEAQFMGPDPVVLHQLADSARRIMEQSSDVYLITTDWEPQIPVLTIEYDQPTARAIGLSRNDVSLSLLSATSGIPIGSFYEGIHKDNIYMRCLDEQGRPIENLDNTQIFSSLPSLNGLLTQEMMTKLKSGTLSKEELVEMLMGTTPLKQISKKIDVKWEDPVIPRYNGQRSQRMQCSPVPGIETEKARQSVAGQIEQIPLPDGYTLQWQGERNASTKSMQYLFKNFPFAIILMIAILIMLFKDYRKPIIIFCCIPLVFVGVVAVMLLTGKTFNFVAIVGTLGLIGMIIKNGIVLMDEITLQINQGIEPVTALIDSSQSRLRPVMMASLTTILGMIPLLPDAMFGSLAASIMGGLLFGTLITLLFIPILYALFFHIKKTDQ